ncbi:GIY-YIG nuclease family protein [Phenylobacterium sp.]|uniref:GIY-YIG nuclease family protein n=1 Tax=Phenylobacterium sp. TaxID=1871053 RepID=UPI002FC5B159
MTDSTETRRVEIYGLTDAAGEIRYIGKANNAAQRFKGHLRECRRRSPLYDWIASLRAGGTLPSCVVLTTCDESAWQDEERRLIAWGRALGYRLLNLADGGNQPNCSPAARSANGRRLAEKIRGDDMFRRIWSLKRDLSRLVRDGLVRNATRARLRAAAAENPTLFGVFRDLPDRAEDEAGEPIGGYGRLAGGRYGAPQQARA